MFALSRLCLYRCSGRKWYRVAHLDWGSMDSPCHMPVLLEFVVMTDELNSLLILSRS